MATVSGRPRDLEAVSRNTHRYRGIINCPTFTEVRKGAVDEEAELRRCRRRSVGGQDAFRERLVPRDDVFGGVISNFETEVSK